MTLITIPRIVIAGTHSGVGKTTITAGLIRALCSRGLKVQAYKVGPDYIDPGYHSLASGRAVHNLDCWLMPERALLAMFYETSKDCDIAIIEGVMGLFDGGRRGQSSTAAIAKLLQAPVILTTDIKSVGQSIAATVLGYNSYDKELTLTGVIFNRAGSKRHEEMAREAVEQLGIPVVGCVYRNDDLAVAERHLGLTPTQENVTREKLINTLGQKIQASLDIDQVINTARRARPVEFSQLNAITHNGNTVKIGVAQDEAFSFYYPGSLAVLEEIGAELVPFSPLGDADLPHVDGLIFGGGFPEMFAQRLAENTGMLEAVRRAACEGIPIYAECGGLMYLTEQIIGFDGQLNKMAGVIPAVCRMQSNLQAVGYVEAALLCDQAIGSKGSKLKGHEFHFSTMEPTIAEQDFPWAFEFRKLRTGQKYRGGYAAGNVTASYLHLHFAGNRQAAEAFVSTCRQFHKAAHCNLDKAGI